MKRLTPLTLICIIAMLISSCSTQSFFSPGLNGNNIAYMPKPMGTDSVKSKIYVSGSFAGLSLPYSTGQLNMGFLNISRSHTLKNLTFSYGAFGVIGEAKYNNQFKKINTTPIYSYRGFSGGGLRTSIGFFNKIGKNLEFRILSWDSALSFENGAYSTLRSQLQTLNDPDIISSTKTTLFTSGGSTELIWHTNESDNNQIGVRMFFGATSGLKGTYNSKYKDDAGGVATLSLFFKAQRIYGIFDVGSAEGLAAKFSLGYTF
jgi:hypothetical protein